MALAAKRLDRVQDRFWVLLGDSEMAEGSIYESLEVGGFYGLSNLIAILDMNASASVDRPCWAGRASAMRRARAFGWESAVIDGHVPAAIDAAYSAAERSACPTLVVARTKKGAGVSFLTDQEGWNGKALLPEEATRALAELGWSAGGALVVKPRAGGSDGAAALQLRRGSRHPRGVW